MRIISEKRIQDAKKEYKSCATALDAWRKVMKKNEFKNFSELKKTFGSVDKVGNKYVFDIGGNKLRLITSVNSAFNIVYIKQILTHKEYDKNQWI